MASIPIKNPVENTSRWAIKLIIPRTIKTPTTYTQSEYFLFSIILFINFKHLSFRLTMVNLDAFKF